MFQSEAWSNLPQFQAHNWIRYNGEASLAEVAASMAVSCRIEDDDVLVGSSLGGMVACEISRIRELRALYLIGSAIHSSEVNPVLEKLHPLIQITPLDWISLTAEKIPHELANMFSTAEPAFIRSMCPAIFRWQGLGPTTTRVFRVHGKKDRVIYPPANADLLIDGGHLIPMTHAQQCVDFILASLKSMGAPNV